MAKAVDQFRPSDVTIWGIAALGIWALAILSANLSAVIPSSIYGALHASPLDSATLNQLRSRVATLESDAATLARQNNQLLQRLSLSEEGANAVSKRVGALEVSVPKLIEDSRAKAVASAPAVDPLSTGSIGGNELLLEADGGSVKVEQVPLAAATGKVSLLEEEPMPVPLIDVGTTGVMLGFPVGPTDAPAQWKALLEAAGSKLGGLKPVLADIEGSAGKLIVAGPMPSTAAAAELCASLDKSGIRCEPAPFAGTPLPLGY